MKSVSKLLSPQKAVESYLDILLHEVTEPVISDSKVDLPEGNINADNNAFHPESDQSQDAEIESEADQPTPVPLAQSETEEKKTLLETQSVTPVEEVTPSEIIDSLARGEIEQIQRYDFPMQCLMFNVAGNQLSIPLIDMGSVLPWGAKLTPLPHTPEWFLGLLIHRDQNVRVVDTASFMQIQKNNADDDHRHILVFGNDSWAMTCDKLGDVIRLYEQDVKWSKQGKAGLMLGTIKSSLAVLLDPEKILLQLNQGM